MKYDFSHRGYVSKRHDVLKPLVTLAKIPRTSVYSGTVDVMLLYADEPLKRFLKSIFNPIEVEQ